MGIPPAPVARREGPQRAVAPAVCHWQVPGAGCLPEAGGGDYFLLLGLEDDPGQPGAVTPCHQAERQLSKPRPEAAPFLTQDP